jgi:hypothetical protein
MARRVWLNTGCGNGTGFCLCTCDRQNIAYYDTASAWKCMPYTSVRFHVVGLICRPLWTVMRWQSWTVHSTERGIDYGTVTGYIHQWHWRGHKTCGVSSCRLGVVSHLITYMYQQHEVIQDGYALTLRMVQWFSVCRTERHSTADVWTIKQMLISSYRFRDYVINKL